MAMVMPRSRSSGALSIWSKGVYFASLAAARVLVMAAVSVVLPWSMCPIVPTFTWGLVRSNFFFAIFTWLLLQSCLRSDQIIAGIDMQQPPSDSLTVQLRDLIPHFRNGRDDDHCRRRQQNV